MLAEENLKAAYQHFNQAYQFQKNGDLINAIQNYRLSISNFPTIEAHINLASALSKKGRYKDAIEECLAVLRIDGKEFTAYNYIGYNLIKLKKYQDANLWLELALTFEKNINKHLTYFNLGIIYEKRGKWYKAIEMFEKALKINHDFHKARKNMILLSARLN